MSEERILRLENAMATLAEIAAQHNERLAAIERSEQELKGMVAGRKELLASYVELLAGKARYAGKSPSAG